MTYYKTEEKFIHTEKWSVIDHEVNEQNESHQPGWMQYERVLRNPSGGETWEAMVWVVSEDNVRKEHLRQAGMEERNGSRRREGKDNIRRRKSSHTQSLLRCGYIEP